MILFFENGRLGNQLFQYSGAIKFFAEHRIVFFGFESLRRVVNSEKVFFIGKNVFPVPRFFGFLRNFFLFLSNVRLIGTVVESQSTDEYSIVSKRGILPGVYLLKDSFFQHQSAIDDVDANLLLKPDLILKARGWLKENELLSKNLVFLHIRRGDYLSWPSLESPAVLNRNWYLEAMSYISEKVDDPFYLILTDDQHYALDMFGESINVAVSNNDLDVDLALMSLCSHGVLSASSYAWWGACLSKKNKSTKLNQYFIAPNYWVGHRSKSWHPKGFFSNWITYI